ncbi:short-chain dehydrogenase [Pseudoclavibacter sp. RFBG4]|uniref:SDR family NAD(P)-dependent oxidoreductase n=1 Tax=unclassified Pseudoclavibacter TaxID=2615177 RepID=UPI000CE80B45|nr:MULTISPECIES: glucose 1-dehydrogenase [unclassified Pseudoclavibacter]MBF4459918.1 glucose 1-dehydrogenase [Pseudoclavibacter sp. VKM Ac-2867]MBF4549910.1 glucose 1-dehydrogenase [Pseudoclavibacter sp. VKM Ac-2888]PPF76309.1 short-chain dehydrogenase [Pseudoclavibacter sp. Z016]PPG27757.1 short-chain dehydrogenase [Pseudoclavibacter sp. RFBG4]VXB72237.1 2,5-dichloro-2,5-cyclohexadiene-1,4-diol dehydrogenase [Pseudoclavibacter sp. 8L]
MAFAGKVAIVTGGGSGIGEAISKELAANGVQVVVSDINLEGAKRVVAEIEAAGGTASPFEANTAVAEDSVRTVEHAVATYGKLNYAVNNAGIGGKAAPAADVEVDDWDRVININLNGVLYGLRAQIPAILEAGAEEGAIVNMASIHGTVAAIGSGAYTASKHAVVGITKNSAAEYGPQGLRINAVGPGYISTPLLEKHLSEEQLEALVAKHPLGRLGKAEEVANLTTYLLSDKASFMTGSYVLVDGGYTAV